MRKSFSVFCSARPPPLHLLTAPLMLCFPQLGRVFPEGGRTQNVVIILATTWDRERTQHRRPRGNQSQLPEPSFCGLPQDAYRGDSTCEMSTRKRVLRRPSSHSLYLGAGHRHALCLEHDGILDSQQESRSSA